MGTSREYSSGFGCLICDWVEAGDLRLAWDIAIVAYGVQMNYELTSLLLACQRSEVLPEARRVDYLATPLATRLTLHLKRVRVQLCDAKVR